MENPKDHPSHDTQENSQSESTSPGPESVTAEEQLKVQLDAEKQKYLYLYAEFENYKKRMIKERSDILKFGWEPLARDLIQILDNFDRARNSLRAGQEKQPANSAALLEGLEMIYREFQRVLEAKGIKAISIKGADFDPNHHEAVSQVASDKPAGSILQEESKGYLLHDRLLRPARVILSAGNKKE